MNSRGRSRSTEQDLDVEQSALSPLTLSDQIQSNSQTAAALMSWALDTRQSVLTLRKSPVVASAPDQNSSTTVSRHKSNGSQGALVACNSHESLSGTQLAEKTLGIANNPRV